MKHLLHFALSLLTSNFAAASAPIQADGADVRMQISCGNGLVLQMNDVTTSPGNSFDTFGWIREPGRDAVYGSIRLTVSAAGARTVSIPNLFCSEALIEQNLAAWKLVSNCEGNAMPPVTCLASRQ